LFLEFLESGAKNLLLVAAKGRPVALVFTFFSCGKDSLRSWLGPGWRELAICDLRLSIAG
jgi:hypothetical protein